MPKKETANTISKEELDKASEALAAVTALENKEKAEAKAKEEAKILKEEEDKAKKGQKKGKAKNRGKNYTEARKKLNKDKEYSAIDAIKELRKVKYANFDESVELHVAMGIDPKNTDHRVRFTASLPFGTGRSVRVLVISDSKKESGKGIEYKGVEAIDQIVKGTLLPGKDFDVVITTPAFMKDIAKAAKILGPKGIMPNPKNGTVTNDIDKTLNDLAKGQVEIKNQAGHSVLHALIGNVKFKDEEIAENVNFVMAELMKNQPGKLKKKFIQKAYISTSMSPSLRLAI